MNEGLYRVQFHTERGAGYGVVYLKGGQIHGGDTGMYYVGSYKVAGDRLSATLKTDSHTKSPAVSESVFGIDRANITLNGTVSGNSISTTGTASEAPSLTFKADLTFLCE